MHLEATGIQFNLKGGAVPSKVRALGIVELEVEAALGNG
jgi:hypothetical protein